MSSHAHHVSNPPSRRNGSQRTDRAPSFRGNRVFDSSRRNDVSSTPISPSRETPFHIAPARSSSHREDSRSSRSNSNRREEYGHGIEPLDRDYWIPDSSSTSSYRGSRATSSLYFAQGPSTSGGISPPSRATSGVPSHPPSSRNREPPRRESEPSAALYHTTHESAGHRLPRLWGSGKYTSYGPASASLEYSPTRDRPSSSYGIDRGAPLRRRYD
ncbi:hypothetical protein MMC09_003025 [Bachmanniomyces sp. S44760]|nr:hypothetical protein [Bachmanniomyces sp. S44760]